MKSVIRVILALFWIAGITALGGATGVWIGKRTIDSGSGLLGAFLGAARLQDMFIGGLAVGLVVSLFGLVLFTAITSRRRASSDNAPNQADAHGSVVVEN